MKQVLSLSFRPRSLDAMVGQEELTASIRGHLKKKRVPQCWMFVGESGAGKTTAGRILGLSLQCTHQTKFGAPCKDCRHNARKFDIFEINASQYTGKQSITDVLDGSDYAPRPGSRARVYILDEVQMLSRAAQNMMLKVFEDCPRTTYFILCTTDPDKIVRTLRRRCGAGTYTVASLKRPGVRILVKRALKHVNSKLDSDALVDALFENEVTSAGMVVNAVEKYTAGEPAEKAAKVEVTTGFDTYSLCRGLIKGLWGDVSKQLKDATPEDARVIRKDVARYLKAILLDDEEISSRATVVAEAIEKLTSLSSREESLQLSATVAVLYQVAKFFNRYHR